MKTIITLTLCLLLSAATTSFAAGGVKINGDVTLEQGASPPSAIYFSNGSSQLYASPWSILTPGTDIYYNPLIPGNVGIGTSLPLHKLDVVGNVNVNGRITQSGPGGGVFADTLTDGTGLMGLADNGTNAWGVYGTSTDGVGVKGASQNGIGLSAQSATGKAISATVNGTEVMKVDATGVRSGLGMTGTPLAHGYVTFAGTLFSHSSNVSSVSHTIDTGVYDISITSEFLAVTTHTPLIANADSTPGYSSFVINAGKLRVTTFNTLGVSTDRAFTFIIMKM